MIPHVFNPIQPKSKAEKAIGETIEVSAPWRNKVHKVIYALCKASYLKANQLPNGQLRKRHVPYTVPQEAQDLIKCLNSNDEVTAKSLMMHDYAISKL